MDSWNVGYADTLPTERKGSEHGVLNVGQTRTLHLSSRKRMSRENHGERRDRSLCLYRSFLEWVPERASVTEVSQSRQQRSMKGNSSGDGGSHFRLP